MCRNYCLECKTTCTLKEVRKPSKVLICENSKEKTYFIPATGRVVTERKYNPCDYCPFNKAKKAVEKDVYLIII